MSYVRRQTVSEPRCCRGECSVTKRTLCATDDHVFECRLLTVSLVLGLSSGIISLQDIHSRFTVCASDNLTRSVVRYKFVTYFPDNTSTQHLTTLGLCVCVCLSVCLCLCVMWSSTYCSGSCSLFFVFVNSILLIRLNTTDRQTPSISHFINALTTVTQRTSPQTT